MSFNEYTVAEEYHCNAREDRNAAFGYMLRHFSHCHVQANFRHYIDFRTLKCLISSPAVQGSPKERLDAVLGWTRYDEYNRRQDLADLLVLLPGALLGKEELKRLLRDPLVKNSARAQNAVQDLIDGIAEPYFQTSTTHALGLSDVRESGGDKLFGFVSAACQAEFEVAVEVSPCMTHVRYLLKCKRVAVGEDHRLPTSVQAHLRVKLCHENGPHGGMDVVRGGCIEEDGVVLIGEGDVCNFRRRVHFDSCEMASHVSCKRKIALFIEVLQFNVNGRNCDYRSSVPALVAAPVAAPLVQYYWAAPTAVCKDQCQRVTHSCSCSSSQPRCVNRCEQKCENACKRGCEQRCRCRCAPEQSHKWHCEAQRTHHRCHKHCKKRSGVCC